MLPRPKEEGNLPPVEERSPHPVREGSLHPVRAVTRLDKHLQSQRRKRKDLLKILSSSLIYNNNDLTKKF